MDSSILPNKVKAQNLTPQYVRAKQIEHRPLPQTIEVDGKQRSTTNSNSQPISATEEGVRNFWKWFGDSTVVDAEGKPLVVYHGTKSDFHTFDLRKSGATDDGLAGKGFYLTYNPQEASGYAESNIYGKGSTPTVIPVYVAARNPLPVSRGALPDGRQVNEVHNAAGWGINAKGGAAVKKIAADGGHDGVAWLRPDGGVGHLAVYNPTQIKSAIGNSGQFDPANPNIVDSPEHAFYEDSSDDLSHHDQPRQRM